MLPNHVRKNDRFILDQLWHRSDDLKKFHKDWFEQDPHFSDSEKNDPYVRLMIVADPKLERDVTLTDDIDLIRTALGDNTGILGAVPFDTVYTTSDGYIGRQLLGNDPQSLGLSWHVRNNLSSDVIIPLRRYKVDQKNVGQLVSDLNGYDYVSEFIQVLCKYKINTIQMVDLTYLLNILIGVAETQERLCNLAGWNESYHIKVKVLNAWRTVPFIDVSVVVDFFDKFGLPMCLNSNDVSPKGYDHTSYKEISRYRDQNDSLRILLQALRMFAPVAHIYGIPVWFEPDENDSKPIYYVALQDAGRRSMLVQQNRNNKQR